MNRLVWVGLYGLLSCGLPVTLQAQPGIHFEDFVQSSGIVFEHFSGRSGHNYIIETVTAGLATFDFDRDGWIDVYFLNGANIGQQTAAAATTNRLFRNNLGTFVDVTESSGAGDTGFGLGVAAGDFDNDGDQDLFVSNFGPNVLLVNNGDGTFERRQFPCDADRPKVGAGVALLDVEGDGNLDVYFANYVDFNFEQKISRLIYGVPAAPGPKDYNPEPDTLLRNMGDGSFADVSAAAGIAGVAGAGMGVVAFDFDSDRDTDIFVCNDSAANFLFENLGDFKFEEIGLLAGVAFDLTGAQQASMGADVADVDADGDLDLVTTNFIDEIPTLYRNSGQGYFDDVGAAMGLGSAARSLTWGVGFADFDLDSWPDMFVASGHLIDGISRVQDTEKFAQPNHIFHNMSGTVFRDVRDSVGSAGNATQVSRGVAVDDIDNDGDCDVVVLNLNDHPQLLRNTTQQKNNFLQLQLVGGKSNRDAIGAKVKIQLGNRTLLQEVIAGRGYQSHFGSRLTFGVGTATQIESLQVQWPSGTSQHLNKIRVNQNLLIREGDLRL